MQENQAQSLAISLARRVKRLKYWQERFGAADFELGLENEFMAKFETFQRLIARLGSANSPLSAAGSGGVGDERLNPKQIELELDSLERELEGLFESRRLMTNRLGVGAVTDYSCRGGERSAVAMRR